MKSQPTHVPGPDAPATRFWQKINLIAEISELCRRQKPDAPSFSGVLQLIQGIIPFDAAALYLKIGHAGGFILREQWGGAVLPPDIVVSWRNAETGEWQTSLKKPLLWTGEENDDDFESDNDFLATLSVPLMIESEVIGLLSLGTYVDGVLAERHIKLLSIVADQLAVSIERLNQMAEIQAQNQSLHEAHEQLKVNQKRIIAAEKLGAVVELAASVNHEINNPLSVVIGNVQCLKFEDTSLCPKTISRLHRIEQAALRIGEVNRRLLKIDSVVSDAYLEGAGSGIMDLQRSTRD